MIRIAAVLGAFLFQACVFSPLEPESGQLGIWTSTPELAEIPMSGPAWEELLKAANNDSINPEVSDQNNNSNVYVLASAIVYARTADSLYQEKVIDACERLIDKGWPDSTTLAWSRETGAYVLAADLVGYRTFAFELWLRHMADIWTGVDNRTMRETFQTRPNNWGSHAFGSLCAIYRYLNDFAALSAIRDYWIQGVLGPNPGYEFDDDLSWHSDTTNLRLINPRGAVKNGMNLDGIIPDDMRRGSAFRIPPAFTGYPWEFLQGQIMAARILERAGMPIWDVADSALYRAAFALQVRLDQTYCGAGWAAKGSDTWMLPFLDEAYGTAWSRNQPRLWRHGKNAGWGYVTLGPRN